MTGPPLAARLLCDEPSAGVARLLRLSQSSARSLWRSRRPTAGDRVGDL